MQIAHTTVVSGRESGGGEEPSGKKPSAVSDPFSDAEFGRIAVGWSRKYRYGLTASRPRTRTYTRHIPKPPSNKVCDRFA